MKKTILVFAAIAAIYFINEGCSKKKGCKDPVSINYDPNAETDDGSCEYAGLGGNTTIVAFPKHHGVSILNKATYPDSAFVKFNVTESPGSSAGSYDKIFVGETGEDHIHLAGLKPGKYYIMMSGFDSSIVKRVSGGIPYTLTQTSGEVDLVVPVTE
jgi:hypothetical protein